MRPRSRRATILSNFQHHPRTGSRGSLCRGDQRSPPTLYPGNRTVERAAGGDAKMHRRTALSLGDRCRKTRQSDASGDAEIRSAPMGQTARLSACHDHGRQACDRSFPVERWNRRPTHRMSYPAIDTAQSVRRCRLQSDYAQCRVRIGAGCGWNARCLLLAEHRNIHLIIRRRSLAFLAMKKLAGCTTRFSPASVFE